MPEQPDPAGRVMSDQAAHRVRRRRGRRFAAAASLSALTLGTGACGSGDRTPDAREAGSPARGVAEKPATHRDFDPANFTDPTTMDNTWSPAVPGEQATLVGRANRGHGLTRHRVVSTVTDLTKVIDGVRTRVMWDQDINGSRLLEEELAFFAQDDDGNVWNLGEYPEEREGGKVVGAPDTWISGVDRARAGIMMRANPQVGTSSYRQGLSPKIGFRDRARVLRTGRRTCVPLGCYDDVLITDEWNETEPGAHERKYYAPGVGNVRVGFASGPEKEQLVLVKVKRLGPRRMAKIRAHALRIDRRGYTLRKRIYGKTPPAEPAP